MLKSPYFGADDLNAAQLAGLEQSATHEMARRSIPAALTYLLALSLLVISSPHPQDDSLMAWLAGSIFISMLATRLVLLRYFDRLYQRSRRVWCRIKILAVAITSLTWGLISAITIIKYDETWTAMIAALITVGMCTGALHSVGISLKITRIYLLANLLPNIIAGFIQGGTSGATLVTIFIVTLLYNWAQSRHVNREFWESRINAVRLDSDTRNRLHKLTYHDTLTDLPNRDLFNDRLDQAISGARRRHTMIAVMVLGLDRFSQINDTLGHNAGDELLKAVAHRLKSCIREHDTLARYSGDVFTVILTNLNEARNVARIASKMQEQMATPIEVAGLELFVSASIGIAVFPADSESAEVLLKNAEATMYRVKQQGGNRYQYFETSINTEAMERLQLEARLRRALERNEFALHYQPKVNLATGQLSGFEALLRWHPEGSAPISPAKFIPILEDTGLIVPVGEWVLRTACAQNKAWHSAGLPPVRIAVNLSARQFRDHGLAGLVNRVLTETRLEPRWLELEITESMLMDDTNYTLAVLEQLHGMGIHLSIDDFGTGYSSLAYLKRMPIHSLKIDRSFVQDITTDNNDAAVVQTIIAMAHILNLRVVAEGTETAEQVAFLREQHCDETQGFYFSRPLPADELYDMLQHGFKLQDSTAANNSDNTIILHPRHRA